MIYKWFKRNRPFPKARDTASRAHFNRGRKLQSFLAEIAVAISNAVDQGERYATYRVASEDAWIVPELVERLRTEGYMVTHAPIEPEDPFSSIPVTLSWVPPKGVR